MVSQPQIKYMAIAVIISGSIGFLINQIIPRQDTIYITEYISEESGEKIIKEGDIPFLSSILLSPLISNWRIFVSGELVEKTDSTFTIEKDGNQMTIVYEDGYTAFQKFSGPGVGVKTSLAEISLGTFVRGSVLVSSKDTEGFTSVKNEILGEGFRILP